MNSPIRTQAGIQWSVFILVCAACTVSRAEDSIERLIFLGPLAPRLLDVEISSGRFSIEATRQKYTEGLFQLLDKNKDGSLNDEEAQQIPKQGRLRAALPKLGAEWKSLDVAPEDGTLNVEELRQHIDSALGAKISVERAPPKLTQTVRLYKDLDLNADGRITADEVENGLTALHSFDFDDDETLSVAELQPFPLSVIQAQQQEQAIEEPVPLLLLNTEEERTLAAERCVNQYGDGEFIGEEFMTQLAGRQARRFDKDRDRKWNVEETAECFKMTPAEIQLSISLAPPRVRLLSDPSQREDRPTLDLGGVPVETLSRNMRWMATSNVSLLKTTRFANADTDGNKYLNEQEFFGLSPGNEDFASVDLDGNGQVTREEIGEFFTLDGLANQARVILSLSDEAKTLFEILDQDNDRRLQPKEFREGRGHLLAFDLNHDHALVQGELASRFRITFTQPELFAYDPRRNADTPQERQGIVREQGSGPVWFQRMDRNLDQEISWREFLGSKADFDKLDENKNGYLESSEAELAEQLRE